MPETTKTALNAGELSDLMAGRPDLSKFQMGCEILENARVLRVGGVTRRAGLLYADMQQDQDKTSRLKGFGFSSDQGVCLEFAHLKMNVFKNGEKIAGPITTPWTEDQVFELDFSQRIDRIIVAHGDVPLQSIFRNSDTSWTIEEFPWDQRIFESYGPANATLDPSGTTSGITITASEGIFDSDDWIGQRLQLTYTQNQIDFEDTAAVTVPEVEVVQQTRVYEGWEFETSGKWTGTFRILRSYDGGTTFDEIKSLSSANDENYILSESEEIDAEALFKVVYSGSTAADFRFTRLSVDIPGEAIITARTSTTVVDATVEKELLRTGPTSKWKEEAFSDRNGYPKTSTFHQKRLFLGGSKARPQNVYGSRTRRPFDFTAGTLDDDGLIFEVDSEGYESVIWLVSHLTLVVGTTSGVWSIAAPDGRFLTPENNSANKHIKKAGFEGIPGVHVDENILYLQRKGRKVHELSGGTIEYGGYTSVDLTQLASQVTAKGVTQLTAGEIPDSSLYLNSGPEVSILTYERPQNVVGWARWLTDGDFESTGTCPGAGEDDDIYFAVNRNGTRTIEYLSPDMLRIEEAGTVEDLMFLDSAVVFEPGGTFTTITGLTHLEGREVTVYADGETVGEFTVASGEIELGKEYTKAVAGLRYSTKIRPMNLDYGSLGSKSANYEVRMRLRNSLGGYVTQEGKKRSRIPYTQPRTSNGEPPQIFSGDIEAFPHSTWKRGSSITIEHDEPLPFTLLAMKVKAKTTR